MCSVPMPGQRGIDVTFAATLLSTVFCFAVNAYTLRLTYPLWRTLDAAGFRAWHAGYLARLMLVVTVPHVAAFFASVALLVFPPLWLGSGGAAAVLASVSGVIVLSLLVAGPVHDRFTRTGVADKRGVRLLLRVSLVRTVLCGAATMVLLRAMLRGLVRG